MKTIQLVCSYVGKIIKLKKRVRQLKRECKKLEAQNVMIWGANDYAKSILLNLDSNMVITKIIDAKAKSTNDQFLGINITSLQSINRIELTKVDAIILATDTYLQSMRNDLAEIDPAFLKKVIAF